MVTKAFQLKMFIRKSPYYPLGLYNFFDKDDLEHIGASASLRLFKAASFFSPTQMLLWKLMPTPSTFTLVYTASSFQRPRKRLAS